MIVRRTARFATAFLVYVAVSAGVACFSSATGDAATTSCCTEGRFHVQGWRWHTMSLAREVSRLQNLALRLQSKESDDQQDLSALKDAAEYVIGFNMKGLHSIEKDLFFPWVRKKVKSEKEVNKALDQLENDRLRIEKLGAALVSVVYFASKRKLSFSSTHSERSFFPFPLCTTA